MSTDASLGTQQPDELGHVVERVFPGLSWSAQRIDGGMTNLNWRVTIDGQQQVFVQLMMPRQDAAKIGIDRDVQRRVLALTEPLGFSPTTLALLDDPAAIVTEFIEAVSLPESGQLRARGLTEVAQILAELHRQPVDESMRGLISDPFDGVRWLTGRAIESVPARHADIKFVTDLVNTIEAARGPIDVSVIHGDLSLGNILLTESDTILIDWEYAGLGDRWADLGTLSVMCELSPDEEVTVVHAYGEEASEQNLALVRVHRLTQLAREVLWSLATANVEFSDFDHLTYADQLFAAIHEYAASPLFMDSLRVLQHLPTGPEQNL